MVTNIPDMPPLSRMGEKDSGNSTRNAETEKRERRRREKCPKRCGPKTAVKRGPGHCPPHTARHGVRKVRLPSIREKCWLKYIWGSATAHKFQGREHDVIIMSTVLDSSWSAEKGGGFVDEACLVNVAISRAREQFVLELTINYSRKMDIMYMSC